MWTRNSHDYAPSAATPTLPYWCWLILTISTAYWPISLLGVFDRPTIFIVNAAVFAIVEEREPTKEEISMVDDWYNNIDIIEPIKDEDEYPLIHD